MLSKNDKKIINCIMLAEAEEFHSDYYNWAWEYNPERLQDLEAGNTLWDPWKYKRFAIRRVIGSHIDDIYANPSHEKYMAYIHLCDLINHINHIALEHMGEDGFDFEASMFGITGYNTMMFTCDWGIRYGWDYYLIRETHRNTYVQKIDCGIYYDLKYGRL